MLQIIWNLFLCLVRIYKFFMQFSFCCISKLVYASAEALHYAEDLRVV
jgi:hypothetical protein